MSVCARTPVQWFLQWFYSVYLTRREAKDKNRESWYMAYIMDTNEEERAKGKTVEVRSALETCSAPCSAALGGNFLD